MNLLKEQAPDRVKRRLLKTGGALFLASLGLEYYSRIANAQTESDAPENEHNEFSFTSSLIHPSENDTFEPYPGRPWTRTTATILDQEGKKTKWEKISIITPEKPYRFTHDPQVGSWSMQSLMGGNPFEPQGHAVILADLELDAVPTAMNTGVIIQNGESVRSGNHRRISVGSINSELFFAYWDGSPTDQYTINKLSLSPLKPDPNNRLLMSIGIFIPSDGKTSEVLLPDGQTTSIYLNGSSFYPSAKRMVDVSASTTPNVINTVHSLLLLHKLPDPNIAA